MPLVPNSGVVINNQILPNGVAPYTQQYNCGQLIGAVNMRNPDLSQPKILSIINDGLRVILDRKTWFGLMVYGQLVSPQAITQGQVTATLGSTAIVGTGTAWTDAIVGLQFRIGYNNPIYTIASVDIGSQTLQLQLPWGSPTITSGYFIVQNYFNVGPNIKYLKTALNMQLGYKFYLHATQDTLNTIDPWRQNSNFPYIMAGMPAGQDGSYMQEMYPASWIQQAFPFTAYVQPPNLVGDMDNLPPFIRGDVLLKYAISEALVIGGPKHNEYYDPNESTRQRKYFEGELQQMSNADENLYRTEYVKMGEDLPYFTGGGALWSAQHAVAAYGSGGGYGL